MALRFVFEVSGTACATARRSAGSKFGRLKVSFRFRVGNCDRLVRIWFTGVAFLSRAAAISNRTRCTEFSPLAVALRNRLELGLFLVKRLGIWAFDKHKACSAQKFCGFRSARRKRSAS